MTDNDNFCPAHSGNMELIRAHERQLEKLFENHDEMKEMLGSINTHLATLGLEMKAGFTAADSAIKGLSMEISGMNTAREKTLVYYDAIVVEFNNKFVGINKQFAELERFAWFRHFANKMRQVLVYGFFVALFYVMVSHWSDIGDFLRKKIGG